jgi:hypothetical protein
MRLKQFYDPKNLDPTDIRQIRATFVQWFDGNDSCVYRLTYRNKVATFQTIAGVEEYIEAHGLPEAFFHRRLSTGGREAVFDATDPAFISIEAYSDQLSPDEFINSISKSLGLRPHEAPRRLAVPAIGSAFVCVPFSADGRKYAGEMIEFLKTVGIDAKTALEYHPEDFRDKIRRLIDESDLVFVIAIPNEDLGFIISEATYAHTIGKPIFILAQTGTAFTPALIGSDHERAEFGEDHLCETFTRILQGIRHLNNAEPNSAGPGAAQ